jgi:hypothetical protein
VCRAPDTCRRRASQKDGSAMFDILLPALGAGFFLLAIAYVAAAERL